MKTEAEVRAELEAIDRMAENEARRLSRPKRPAPDQADLLAQAARLRWARDYADALRWVLEEPCGGLSPAAKLGQAMP